MNKSSERVGKGLSPEITALLAKRYRPKVFDLRVEKERLEAISRIKGALVEWCELKQDPPPKPRKHTRLTCDRCGKEGGAGPMKQHHFQHCKWGPAP